MGEEICPACLSENVRPIPREVASAHHDPTWRCADCGHAWITGGSQEPWLHGYFGDGELCVQVTPVTDYADAALTWVTPLGARASDWRVVGRAWSRLVEGSIHDGNWEECARGAESAVEYWLLEEARGAAPTRRWAAAGNAQVHRASG
jgi:hypothetical protein